jgi:hypothetical protein
VANAVSKIWRSLWQNIITRLVAYYALMLGGGYLVWRWLPHAQIAGRESFDALFSSTGFVATSKKEAAEAAAAVPAPDQLTLSITVLLAMVSAALLTLPVAWVYTLTRAKRGYQQSVVQTLIMLPVVVAGVVVMVKYSVALAFSLAGIVAAVRFRNTLDDSKDAVYIFLATGTGLAAAVALPVALVVSVLFNVVVLLLWSTDFGRAPNLEGTMATRRVQRTAESMTRTGTFVARMDRDLLQQMTADQLQAVADRAKKRARELTAEDLGGSEKDTGLLRVRTYDVANARRRVEVLLDDQLKTWEFSRLLDDTDGTRIIEYNVRLKKSSPREAVLDTLRRMGAPDVVGAEMD